MLALLGAFGQEIVDLRRRMAVAEVVTGRGCKLYRGKLENRDALLVKTGMGKERAENATELMLERYPVSAIISLGFAGALAPELSIGDVVICSTLHCARKADDKWVSAGACVSDERLLSLASQGIDNIPARCRLGSSVSVLQLESSTKKLQGLAEAFHAHIVDMESYWIARIASSRQIPFIAIRSISDTAQENVQPFDRILAPDGRLLAGKAIWCFVTHPQYLINTFTLYRNVRIARKSLYACVSHLVNRM
ncbi:MAG: 5'-methylthioadenosine/S-adenosylhomocysteine nucleosidase [Chloroflexi bacterium]|nr:5'-methylthioadenosine/S-adenosylhomocysteine nucleosidase [Chloroflexota bacterium]